MLEPSWIAYPRHCPLWREAALGLAPHDLSHDADHLRRVYAWALRLAPSAGAGPELAGAAALLHDLVAVPKEDPARSEASARSAAAAAAPLQRAGYDDDEAAQVIEAVRTSSWSRGLAPSGPLGAVLQDADRLDAIGAVGIARTFACAQAMTARGRGLCLYDPGDPLAARREPEEARYALDHFRVKLLTLAAGMNLPLAREEAARRQAAMLAFLAELEREAALERCTPRIQESGAPGAVDAPDLPG